MLKHWLSVTLLLLPVMTFGWLLSSVFIWKLVPTLRWIEALVLAACITATDPVLASAVVGKGKFAQRVPGHLRNLLSAESGCNDGMAFPFAYLALRCILHEGHPRDIVFHWVVVAVIYECIFGCVLGAIIGYLGRHLIKFAEQKNLIDRESFLVFYVVLALFCTGVGSIVGIDDLLVAFSAGCAFSWDGWFAKKTEESHVSDVIDSLLNMSYFVYFGAIVPWDQFNNADIGISIWKLIIIAILVILFRRIPVILALKPFIPDIKTWREALFCGHFGPIGVGGIFMSLLARAELEHSEPTPLAELPDKDHPNYFAIATIWPVVTFLIISSIVVHGSSIAVFTLGKRLNNLTITLTATTRGSTSQGWLSRIGTESGTFSLLRIDTNKTALLNIAPSSNPEKPGLGKRQKRKKASKRRRDGEEPTPPATIALDLSGQGRGTVVTKNDIEDILISTNDHSREPSLEEEAPIAIIRTRDNKNESEVVLTSSEMDPHFREKLGVSSPGEPSHLSNEPVDEINAYKVGDTLVLEDHDGEVLQTINSRSLNSETHENDHPPLTTSMSAPSSKMFTKPLDISALPNAHLRKNSDPSVRYSKTGGSSSARPQPRSRKITAYQLDDEIVVENEDGDIIKRYHVNYKSADSEGNSQQKPKPSGGIITSGLTRTLSHLGIRKHNSALGTDLENQAYGEQPGVSSSKTASASRPSLDDERMRRYLKQLLAKDSKVNRNIEKASNDGFERDESSEYSEEYSSDESSASSTTEHRDQNQRGSRLNPMGRRIQSRSTSNLAKEDEETEVERQRRHAALGIIEDDDEDLDDDIYHRR